MTQRPPAIFVGDAPGLDFLNSIATPADRPVDWIDNGEGLLDWLEQARLVPADALETVRAHALPGELDAVADQANRASASAIVSASHCSSVAGWRASIPDIRPRMSPASPTRG